MRKLIVLFLLALIPSQVRSGALLSGSQSCPTSGVKRLIATSTKASWVQLQAAHGNTGAIAFGGSNVAVTAACAAPGTGNCLIADWTAMLPPAGNASSLDMSQIWIACTVSGDTMLFNYLQ